MTVIAVCWLLLFLVRQREVRRTRPMDWVDCWSTASPLELDRQNHRFLILPLVGVHCLASHLLGQVARRIGEDWRHKYGHSVVLLESFVERERFAGTCYRAANGRHWVHARAQPSRPHPYFAGASEGSLRLPAAR